MSQVILDTVTYGDLSAIKHTIAISQGSGFAAPEFIVVQFDGTYRVGSTGAPDAAYIMAMIAAARRAWQARATIIDFRELDYRWGDEMEWIAAVTREPGSRTRGPLAIVVGDACRDALRSLLEDDYERLCVENVDDAVVLCRHQSRADPR